MRGINQYFSPSKKKCSADVPLAKEDAEPSAEFIHGDILLLKDASMSLQPVLFLEFDNDSARVKNLSTLEILNAKRSDLKPATPEKLLELMNTAVSQEDAEVFESAIHIFKAAKQQRNINYDEVTVGQRKRKRSLYLECEYPSDSDVTGTLFDVEQTAVEHVDSPSAQKPIVCDDTCLNSGRASCDIDTGKYSGVESTQLLRCVASGKDSQRKDLTQYSFHSDGCAEDLLQKTLNSIKEVGEQVSGALYPHHTFQFLQKGAIRDKFGVLHSDANADVSTLFIPDSYLKSKEVTPAMRQWWKFKSEYFDAVLLFKLGKFYETYHMDADIIVEELGLIYMKGRYAHAGFPESSFTQHSCALIQKGYKVARIEQTETPEMLAERAKSQKVEDKVVTRELCSVITPGTRIFDPFDVEVSADSHSVDNGKIGFGSLVCICDFQTDYGYHVGMVVLDTSIGQFYLSQFGDDDSFSHLRTMVAYVPLQVAEVILPKGNVSYNLRSYVHRNFAGARREYLNGIYNAKSTIQLLMQYSSANEGELSETELYRALGIDVDDAIDYELAMLALGCCVKYLEKNKIATRILKQKKFVVIKGNGSDEATLKSANNGLEMKYMILDHSALSNIDILVNNDDDTDKAASLLGLLDNCCTPFGKRLLPTLLSQPFYRRKDIIERQNAIEELMNLENIDSVRTKLQNLPDLDRLLFRIHSYAIVFEDKQHPDNRAFIFNPQLVDGRKVTDLINCLQGLSSLCEIAEELKLVCCDKLLLSLLTNSDGNEDTMDCFQKTKETVQFFTNAFDISLAKNTGRIEPRKGLMVEYDESVGRIEEIKSWLDTKLREIKRLFRGHQVRYVTFNKEKYLIEVPNDATEAPPNYIYKCQRKGFRRYQDPEVELKVEEMREHEVKKDEALKSSLGCLVRKLASNKSHLELSVRHIALLDCLISFAKFSKGQYNCTTMCKPVIVDSQEPFIKIEEGYHPFLATKAPEFVVNNIILGTDYENMRNNQKSMIITGPNMGGKSTIMRQVAVTVVLAQLGCYIPAVACALTPFDRIFARLGASFDKPLNGQSTFYIELMETSSLLRFATKRSLVILDELGRGTSTYDGMAVAEAVLKYITKEIKCLMMFSTHYHYLVNNVKNSPMVLDYVFYNMFFTIDDTQKEESVVFLYKLIPGICSSSYGFNVAKLAGLPESIITEGKKKSVEQEKRFLMTELLLQLSEENYGKAGINKTLREMINFS